MTHGNLGSPRGGIAYRACARRAGSIAAFGPPMPHASSISSPKVLARRLGSPYSAAKTGVTGLTRSLAVELGPEGITVNCICPGPIRTGMTAAIPDDHKTIYAKRRTALKRYGDPEEVAQITVSLCLPAASFITGAVIPVDGGLMARNA